MSKRYLKSNCHPLLLSKLNLQKMPGELENEKLNALLPHICKHRSRIDDYFIIRPADEETGDEIEKQSKFYVFHEPKILVPEPKLDIWAYLDKEGVLSLLNSEKTKLIRREVVSS
nr:unnamed protein product [Callosobruchus analis]